MSLHKKDKDLEGKVRKTIGPKELFPTIVGLIVFIILCGVMPLVVALSLVRNNTF
ncbi:MAG: hypothetical protein GY804_00140 [Alphaproteobacteria bacterium]|nr:hypothetical protein [Alphaproteobacteria bacterium]